MPPPYPPPQAGEGIGKEGRKKGEAAYPRRENKEQGRRSVVSLVSLCDGRRYPTVLRLTCDSGRADRCARLRYRKNKLSGEIVMDLLADRGRLVSLDELNTTQLLAHARKQAVQRNLDDILVADVDSH